METNQKHKPLLTSSNVAEQYQVSERFLQNDRSTKRLIPYVKIGRFVRYREQDVIDFIERNTVGGVA